MILSPTQLQDAVSRAARAASQARALPDWWVATAVEHGALWYVVILGRPPYFPLAAVYRIRPDRRLKRIVRPPALLANHARRLVETQPTRLVPHPGQEAGQAMVWARLHN